jgi:hypothetical protein
MLDLSSCFVEEVVEPVRLIDILPSTIHGTELEGSPIRTIEFKDVADLETYFFTVPSQECVLRFM